MKTKLLTLIAVAGFASLMSCSKTEIEPKATPVVTEDVQITEVNIDDLRKQFGKNLVVEGMSEADIAPGTNIYWQGDLPSNAELQKTGCGGNGLPNCNSFAGAQGRASALANQCCCIIISGYICCAGDNAVLAILFLAEPSNPNCGVSI